MAEFAKFCIFWISALIFIRISSSPLPKLICLPFSGHFRALLPFFQWTRKFMPTLRRGIYKKYFDNLQSCRSITCSNADIWGVGGGSTKTFVASEGGLWKLRLGDGALRKISKFLTISTGCIFAHIIILFTHDNFCLLSVNTLIISVIMTVKETINLCFLQS